MSELPETPQSDIPRSVEDRVVKKLRARGVFGREKYNTTMDRKDLTLAQWATHLQEECLDGAQYAQRVIDAAQLLEEAYHLIVDIEDECGWKTATKWRAEFEKQFGPPK